MDSNGGESRSPAAVTATTAFDGHAVGCAVDLLLLCFLFVIIDERRYSFIIVECNTVRAPTNKCVVTSMARICGITDSCRSSRRRIVIIIVIVIVIVIVVVVVVAVIARC
jgi:hypothetical protein